MVTGHAVDRLRGKADVSDHGNLCFGHPSNEVRATFAAFDFDCMRTRFFDKSNGVSERFLGGRVVRPEWHVCDQKRSLDSTSHGTRMVQHLFHGDGQCALVTEYRHPNGVAD